MPGQRERARQAVMADLTAEGRRQLARDGAAALSLRSVARALGMGSSAVYRYVASRDELLTLLIVDGYERLGAAVELAVAGADGAGGGAARARWRAACSAVRSWAAEHPHEYALLYGSPVPGYAAPPDTIPPATGVYAALAVPLGEAAGTVGPAPAVLLDDGARIVEALGVDDTPQAGVAFLQAVATLFGLVSLERFGHTNNVVTDHDAFFLHAVDALADDLGFGSEPEVPNRVGRSA